MRLVSKKLDPLLVCEAKRQVEKKDQKKKKKSQAKFDTKLFLARLRQRRKQLSPKDQSWVFVTNMHKEGRGVFSHIPSLLAQNNKKQWFVVNQ